jgi:hypothetical protein
LLAALFLAACGGSDNGGDMADPGDLSMPQYLLSGTYAARIRMTAGTSMLDQLMTLDTYYSPNGDGTALMDVKWHPCQVALSSALDVPFAHVLELEIFETTTGTLSGKGEASYTQPTVSLPFGACLSSLTDPLPTDGTNKCPVATDPTKDPCKQTTMRGCAITTVDAANVQWPGIAVPASGLTPDADVLYVDGRLTFALDATPHVDTTVTGSTTSAGVEWHVLACHLRTGAACAPSDVAALNANTTVTVSGGVLQAHAQPSYFNCAQFLTAVEGSLTGLEMFDGGAPDLMGMSYGFADVQHDMDRLGCGTCHDQFVSPAMQLVYAPWTLRDLEYNYRQVLPWIDASTWPGTPKPGGRFVNQAPVPYPIRVKWLDWIARGAPF